MTALQLTIFALAWFLAVYVLNCLIAKRIKAINVSKAMLYTFVMAVLGLVGEVVIDTFYTVLFGHPLWNYRILPIHYTYTSQYSLFLWGLVGFHLYLLHDTFEQPLKRTARRKYKRPRSVSLHRLAFLFCIEAIIFEAVVNLSFLAAYGEFIYYYNPSDLWHITSLQTLPFYLVAGYITMYTLKYSKPRPRLSTLSSAALASIIVFVR